MVIKAYILVNRWKKQQKNSLLQFEINVKAPPRVSTILHPCSRVRARPHCQHSPPGTGREIALKEGWGRFSFSRSWWSLVKTAVSGAVASVIVARCFRRRSRRISRYRSSLTPPVSTGGVSYSVSGAAAPPTSTSATPTSLFATPIFGRF